MTTKTPMRTTTHTAKIDWHSLAVLSGICTAFLLFLGLVYNKSDDNLTPTAAYYYQEEVTVHGTIEDKYRVNDTRKFDIREADDKVVEVSDIKLDQYHSNHVGDTVTIVIAEPGLVLEAWPLVTCVAILFASAIYRLMITTLGVLAYVLIAFYLDSPPPYLVAVVIATVTTVIFMLIETGKVYNKLLNRIKDQSTYNGEIHTIVLFGFVNGYQLCLGKRVWISQQSVYTSQEDLSVAALKG